jgi:hypothetical protein
MGKTALAAAIALGWLLLPGPAAARNIYVNNVAGNDGSTGSKPDAAAGEAGPVKTIAKALRLVGPGDRVVLTDAGQPYRESISLVASRHSGSPAEPLVIEGNGAVLDGSAPVPPKAWEYCGGLVYRFRPPRVEFQQLFLKGRPAERVAGDGGRGTGKPGADLPKLDPLQWCLKGNFIYFAVEGGKAPENYALSFADKQTGITLYSVQCVLIQDLIVQGFQLDGISAFNSARLVHLLRVTCRGNGRSGVTVGGASQVDIESCDLGDNGLAQLLTLPWSETLVRQSQLLSIAAPAWVNRGGKLQIDGKGAEAVGGRW